MAGTAEKAGTTPARAVARDDRTSPTLPGEVLSWTAR